MARLFSKKESECSIKEEKKEEKFEIDEPNQQLIKAINEKMKILDQY